MYEEKFGKKNSKNIIDPAMDVYICKTLSNDMIDQNWISPSI